MSSDKWIDKTLLESVETLPSDSADGKVIDGMREVSSLIDAGRETEAISKANSLVNEYPLSIYARKTAIAALLSFGRADAAIRHAAVLMAIYPEPRIGHAVLRRLLEDLEPQAVLNKISET